VSISRDNLCTLVWPRRHSWSNDIETFDSNEFLKCDSFLSEVSTSFGCYSPAKKAIVAAAPSWSMTTTTIKSTTAAISEAPHNGKPEISTTVANQLAALRRVVQKVLLDYPTKRRKLLCEHRRENILRHWQRLL
jgi:hypothetical protein